MTRARARPHVPTAEAGSVTLELAILAPALLLLLGLLIAAGRISLGGGAVEEAARDAARQASIARTPAEAAQQAHSSAARTLAQQGLTCTELTVDVDTTGFSVPVGEPGQVSATVTCVVALADLGVPGLPGSKTLRAQFLSPLDRYRER